MLKLAKLERKKLGRGEIPTLLLGDSQAVKNTDTADKETKGFCLSWRCYVWNKSKPTSLTSSACT